MRYIDVEWLHDDAREPVRLVSELDALRSETRKLEFFRDGEVGFASATRTSGSTRLGEASVPSLSEINADPQFRGVEIRGHEFEALWRRHVIGEV